MNIRRVFIGSVLAIMAAIGTSALAQTKDVKAFQAEIEALVSKKVPEIWKNHDLKAYGDLLTPDFKDIEPDGKTRDFKGQITFIKDVMASTGKIRSIKVEFHKTTVHGNEMISDATEIWDSDLIDTKGEYGPKGKTYPTVWRGNVIYTHVKGAKIWLLKRVETKGESFVTSDGKPLVPLAKKKK